MHTPFSLQGKSILVTGASSGIGQSIAIQCAAMGAVVYFTGRSLSKLENTYRLMADGYHRLIVADLTIESELNALVDSLPGLDGVVQCAGVGSRVLCKSITKDEIDKVFKPNVEAPILLQSALLARKKINRGSSIVFIASQAAHSPSIGNAIYSASKGALISYAKCLGLELAPRMIRVNCICPAMVWTDLIIQGGITEEELKESQLKYPLKRYGTPEDVAYLAVYLLANASSWMTGSCVDLTGGAIQL